MEKAFLTKTQNPKDIKEKIQNFVYLKIYNCCMGIK